MGPRGLHGLTIKAALVLGFSLTLGVWLFTGYDISRRMSALQDEVAREAEFQLRHKLSCRQSAGFEHWRQCQPRPRIEPTVE